MNFQLLQFADNFTPIVRDNTDPVFERGSRVGAIGIENMNAQGDALIECGPLHDNCVAAAERIEASTGLYL